MALARMTGIAGGKKGKGGMSAFQMLDIEEPDSQVG